MKKWISVIIASATLIFCACDDSSNSNQNNGGGQNGGDVTTDCKASCDGNKAINCVTNPTTQKIEKRETQCEGETPLCVADKTAFCVAPCKEFCKDEKTALHCNGEASEPVIESCAKSQQCTVVDGKSKCLYQSLVCEVKCETKDGKTLAINCHNNQKVETECTVGSFCKFSSDEQGNAKTECLPECTVGCITTDGQADVAVNCPGGAQGEHAKETCDLNTQKCVTQKENNKNIASCVDKNAPEKCVEKCEGENIITCPDGENGNAKSDPCPAATHKCVNDTDNSVKCIKKEVKLCVEKCDADNNAVTCPNGIEGEEVSAPCNDKECVFENNHPVCKAKYVKPAQWISDSCECPNCEIAGSKVPYCSGNNCQITGCDEIKKHANKDITLACFRYDDNNKEAFPKGYCSLTAVKCSGHVACGLASTGNYDKFGACPEKSVMIRTTVQKNVFLGSMTIDAKMCAQMCESDSDCRTGYKCLEREAEVLADSSKRNVKFCNVESNIKVGGVLKAISFGVSK